MEAENNNIETLKPLTAKEQAFCEQYTVDWNKTKAAQRAGYSPKNPAAAAVSAQRLLKKANVLAYIEECKKDTERLAGISRLRSAKTLAAIAYSDAAGMREGWVDLKDFELLTDDQKAAIETIEYRTESKYVETPDGKELLEVETTWVKIKMHSKLAALDQIAKMFGYYEAEKINHSGVMVAKYVPPTPDEIKAIAKALEDEL